mmetsp:Transcript_38536/g.123886  ORF Transcript_38536/g.123886 Transcript_38536/m.123886 type:complete len:224 (-) Transcript_38536:1170-1841(-)
MTGGSDDLMSVRNLLSSSCSSCSSKLRCCSRSSTGLAAGGHTCAGASPLLLLASERRTLTESQGRTSLTVLSPSSSQSSQLCSCTDSKGTNIGNAWSPKARIPRPSTQRVVGSLSASGGAVSSQTLVAWSQRRPTRGSSIVNNPWKGSDVHVSSQGASSTVRKTHCSKSFAWSELTQLNNFSRLSGCLLELLNGLLPMISMRLLPASKRIATRDGSVATALAA